MADRLEIRTRARIRAEQVGRTFPADADYNYFINEAGKTVYHDLLHAGFPFNTTFQSLNLASLGFEEIYPLNSGAAIAGVKSVFRLEGSRLIPLIPASRASEADLRSSLSGIVTHYEAKVGINSGPGLSLYPLAALPSGIIHVYYYPEFTGLAADATVWHGPSGSDELLVLEAARKGASLEDDSRANDLAEEYKKVFHTVIKRAASFDTQNAPVIRDVETSGLKDPFNFDVY